MLALISRNKEKRIISIFLPFYVSKNLCLNLAKRYFSSVLTQKGASMIRVTKKLYELFPLLWALFIVSFLIFLIKFCTSSFM